MFCAPVAAVGESSHLRADASSYSAPGGALFPLHLQKKMKAETELSYSMDQPSL